MKIKETKLHLGCGTNVIDGWLNLDGSWNARLAKYEFLRQFLAIFNIIPHSKVSIDWSNKILARDLRKPLPFESNFFSVIYASHLLEHLYCEEAKSLLKECFRVLRPGGILRVMVPDLECAIKEYIQDKETREKGLAADLFVEKLGFRDVVPVMGSFWYRLYSSHKDFHSHKWSYDSDSLTQRLKEAGFIDVIEMLRHKSRIEDIAVIEKNNGLCVEGVKYGK